MRPGHCWEPTSCSVAKSHVRPGPCRRMGLQRLRLATLLCAPVTTSCANESPPVSLTTAFTFSMAAASRGFHKRRIVDETLPMIAAATRRISKRRSVDETLRTIVEVTREAVPGFNQIGISTLQPDGEVVTEAFIGDVVLRLDEIQYGLGEGPCVDALRGVDMVSAPHMANAGRWPLYAPQAVALGVRSQLALRLHSGDGGTIGSINLYSTTSDEVSVDAQALAGLFSAHSAVALGHAQERAAFDEALLSASVVGAAVGILMERFRVDEDRAHALLLLATSHPHVKLRDAARQIVDDSKSE